ncbi:damage-control phosphatase ARMT1 isoform X2 [Ambystoma mexicanum]|uniref:damage-control phosphatase ARMT1 isoform X2 n=1 Tax=Ambystoma mexicanum TaxID=8296 RepID=UPI0037E8A2C7
MAIPCSLSGKFEGSFAYVTIKDRLPQILTKVIDTVHRHKNTFFEKYGEEGLAVGKKTISFLSKLRNELQTDKPIIALTDTFPDCELWNQYLEYQTSLMKEEGPPSWFKSPWLYVECYMYRRIHEAITLNPPICDFDVFMESKHQSFFESQQAIITLCTYFHEILKSIGDLTDDQMSEELFKLLQVSLWGNKCDLSISAGQDNSQKSCLLNSLQDLKPLILVNDMANVWTLVSSFKKGNTNESSSLRVDIVLDNAGFELVTDLALADFLLSSKMATQIHFHGKSMPWYVSDTTKQDFNWTIKQLQAANHMWMSKCGIKWEGNLNNESWVYHDHLFWSLPHEFCDMAQISPDLYAELQKSNLIIFKGDLNYRKLTGDRKWDFTVPFSQSLNGFQPAPLGSLRTLKSDVQVGLKTGQGEQLTFSDPDWLISGKYGVIQFSTAV